MNNQEIVQQEFSIHKLWIGYPSKNSIEFSGTEQECKDNLQHCISVSKRNGADIVSEDEYQYTCDNYGCHGETVQFIIQ